MENSNLPPRQTRSKRRILPFILVILFIMSAVAGAMLATSSVFEPKKKIPVTQIEKERENKNAELIKAKNKATILIMGVDVREDDVGRSDTLMVATVDPKYDKASLLSIPRDTRVRIYGYGYDKINAAYAYGGEPLTENTVENLIGIDIDHYVIVNVRSFVKIIDAIGGVDIYVPKRMYYEDPWDDDGGLLIDLYPGRQHMDGKTAVTYVRYRDSEGDIGRIQRQQQFVEACIDKVTSPEIITKIPDIIREVYNAVDTDMNFRELLELAGAVKAAQKNGLVTDMVPGYPLYIDEISYWIPDVEEVRYAMAMGLDVVFDERMRERAEKDAIDYKDSIPDNAVDIPEGADNIGRDNRSDSRRKNSRDDSETENYRRADDSESPLRRNYSDTDDSTRRETSTARDEISNRNDTYNRDDSTGYRRDENYNRADTYNRDDYRNDETPRRSYDDRNYSEDRTDSSRRVYDSRTYDDALDDSENTVDRPFEVPERGDSSKTRN